MDIHGFPYPWMSVDVHGYPWIIYGYLACFSSPNGTPLKLRGFRPDKSRYLFCARLYNYQDLQVSTFHFLNFCYFGGHLGPPRISLGAAGATKDHFGGIRSFSDFSRTPKIKKIAFWVFPATVSNKIQGKRCAIDVR